MSHNYTSALAGIMRSLAAGKPVCVDVETDSKPVYEGVTLRVVAISDGDDTVVLDATRHRQTILAMLTRPGLWIAHNAMFDKGVIRETLGVNMSLKDTYTMAHLIDPRQRFEGGTGLRLADLAEHYLSDSKQVDELKAEMKRGGWSWATVPADNPVYLAYAGKDAELTVRLYNALLAYAPSETLLKFEAAIAEACDDMERRGVLVDKEFTEGVARELWAEASHHAQRAAGFGVTKVGSVPQVIKALGTLNAKKETLQPLQKEGNELADAILSSKEASKRAASYVARFLECAQFDGRLHADIRPLQARTARMSISRPPLQQLPASETRIRACLIADPGQVLWSVDFQAVELRVLAALCGDENLRRVMIDERDMHSETAAAIYGEGFTDKQRKNAKAVTFTTLYGGGAAKIASRSGSTLEEAAAAKAGFYRAYPGVLRYSRRLSAEAERTGFVVTHTGRKLPVDRGKGYTALNYMIQSTARDLFAVALLRVYEAGLGQYCLLPVHDEILGQAPEAEAHDVAARVAVAMKQELYGIPITTDAEVGGRSWGTLVH